MPPELTHLGLHLSCKPGVLRRLLLRLLHLPIALLTFPYLGYCSLPLLSQYQTIPLLLLPASLLVGSSTILRGPLAIGPQITLIFLKAINAALFIGSKLFVGKYRMFWEARHNIQFSFQDNGLPTNLSLSSSPTTTPGSTSNVSSTR
jgi:hypothetical protein